MSSVSDWALIIADRPIDARAARVEQVFRPLGLADQARYAVQHIISQALAAKSGRQLGDVAILYRTAEIGDIASEAAQAAGLDFVRIDNAAPYRKCAVISWIEDCAAWCSGGWRAARPKLRSLVDRWCGFRQLKLSDAARRNESAKLTSFLWSHRSTEDAGAFLLDLRNELLDEVLNSASALSDQKVQVEAMQRALQPGGVLAGLELARLGERDGAPNQLNLLTFHSAKGCEYDVVIMLGLDEGVFPWSTEAGAALQESRRLFYVALTRARDEVYLLYSGWSENKFGRRFPHGKSRFLLALE